MTTVKRWNVCTYNHKYDDTLTKCPICKPTKRVHNTKHDVLNSTTWRKFAYRIRERDNNICIRCLVKYNRYTFGTKSNKMTVHHVKSREHYPELIWVDTNCLTMCARCNGQLGTNDELDFDYDIKPLPQHNI